MSKKAQSELMAASEHAVSVVDVPRIRKMLNMMDSASCGAIRRVRVVKAGVCVDD